MWFIKTYPHQRNAWRTLPAEFNGHAPRNNRRLAYRIGQRIIRLGRMMNDLEKGWNERFDASKTLPGVFDASVRTMLDTFPTTVRLPLRWSLSRLLVNPKYGGLSVVKVQNALVFSIGNFNLSSI